MTNIPDNPIPIQVEACQFRGPVAESVAQDIGGAVNFTLKHIFQVGDICPSMQTETDFQASHSADWILADGRLVPGSTYASKFGAAVPDMRGQFLRGKNNGRVDGQQNPDGELALGAQTPDKIGPHAHNVTVAPHNHTQDGYPFNVGYGSDNTTQNPFVDPTGNPSRTDSTVTVGVTVLTAGTNIGNETAGKNITVNYFIRIN